MASEQTAGARYGPSVELAGYVDKRRQKLFFMKKRQYAHLEGTTLVFYDNKQEYDDARERHQHPPSTPQDDASSTTTSVDTTATQDTDSKHIRSSSSKHAGILRNRSFGKKNPRASKGNVGSSGVIGPSHSKGNLDVAKPKSIQIEGATILVTSNGVTIQPKNSKRKYFLSCGNSKEAHEWGTKLQRVAANELESFYKVGKVIGIGSYGEVRLATDLVTNEPVAVKTVQRGKFSSQKEMEFVRREINVMKTLAHPHIIMTYNIFDAGEKVHFVMEYLPGGDLFDAIAAENNFSEANASQIIRDILSAVDYLHSQNICHRDLKPENILCLERTWPLQVKLTDFGTAYAADESNARSNTMTTYVGTPYYMAPEQMRNEKYSFPVDIWACGIILFAMLAGRLPWDAISEFDYCRSVQSVPLCFPDEQWKEISHLAKDLISKMLELDPSKRISAAQALNHRWLNPANASMRRIQTDRSLLTSMSGRQFGNLSSKAAALEDVAMEKQTRLAMLQSEAVDDELNALKQELNIPDGSAGKSETVSKDVSKQNSHDQVLATDSGKNSRDGPPSKTQTRQSQGQGLDHMASYSDSDSGAEELNAGGAGWKHDQELLDILNEAKSLSELGDHVQEIVLDASKNLSDNEN
mmetsp:Transcript_17651/g.30659  ORF Transcript_17651/g.30659 Transcript_17651/m.30659 type:complete len:639 (-) Transcript_17651:248-2164(-)|eukprot:CAMPEP_0184691688 /NCGR_PEP_ID=MMETSP0313-20130426/458_1 /TAXON_ID=2792 /ORGANISM="Porphyridium aerugineum, Strain SAG 1380-2" /LENGTH=638 /DNA_ID=CAMNT_0027149445 /DNA_START=475 /DNA_END=2391 /DNA_ORIENTATION=-